MDEKISKAERLNELLKEAKTLADELASIEFGITDKENISVTLDGKEISNLTIN